MWIFISISDGADAQDAADIYKLAAKYITMEMDDHGATTMNINIFSPKRAETWKQTYMLPFTPLAQVQTTGPLHGRPGEAIESKGQFYLIRNDNGQIVRKLITPQLIKAGSNATTNTKAAPRQASGSSRDSGGVAKRNAARKESRRSR